MKLRPVPTLHRPLPRRAGRRLAELLLALGALATLGLLAPALALAREATTGGPDATLDASLQRLRHDATRQLQADWPGARVEVVVGALDPRLTLAPCARVSPYLPAGSRAWGRTRVGLRCDEGPVRWNVYLPVTVRVWARALVAANPLPAHQPLTESDLREAEVDLAAAPSPALRHRAALLGRSLQRPLAAGDTLRQADLKARQWFAAGDTVSVLAVGGGYTVRGEGQALSAGWEGQPVRVRTEGGRVINGRAVAERQVEVAL
ncbi:flagellar basal body P-ring formation chaperone FlgA [Aquabacterium sp. J223]|uniref:flagellar basal body P-ring formation chaperone FlgA n=1 Tax=Aquabacterium sp. J223 TaxID=2898431 RepID=UPI0021ADD96D|nr:flagellar basal body P-ring formation chaperone FlgA [Aquabacterium sp. J223]UUX97548.1 flagellar basal body P-ring formation chaperone FlgA [Aquabacterium sp. J223]